MIELFVNLQTMVEHRKVRMEEHGATAVEYALMMGLIAIAIIASVSAFGNKVRATFNQVANTMPG